MAEAFRVKADVSLPRALREAGELVDGQKVYETVGVSYNASDVVLASDITPPVRERAQNGELDHLLEGISKEEYDNQKAAEAEKGVYIPEHEAEREVLKEAGHQVASRQQAIELYSAGSEAARESQEEAKSDGADERPNLTLPEVPSLAEVSRGDKSPAYDAAGDSVAEDSALKGVPKPPGLAVGEEKAAAEGEKPKRAPRKNKKDSQSQEQEAPAEEGKE